VFGFIIIALEPWCGNEFPGRKNSSTRSSIWPFALPTAVSGIALTTVFAHNGWIGRYLEALGRGKSPTPGWGVTLALTLISMPFAVRAGGSRALLEGAA